MTLSRGITTAAAWPLWLDPDEPQNLTPGTAIEAPSEGPPGDEAARRDSQYHKALTTPEASTAGYFHCPTKGGPRGR